MQDIKYIVINISINLLCLLIGYILAKLNTHNGVSINTNNRQSSNQIRQNNILIDDKKVVTEIKTDNLEKKFTSLGNQTISDENISSSVNKLKNMKG